MTDRNSSSISTTDAIEAMRARGIDNAESLISCTSPARIIATCKWWDGRSNVTPGLLAMRIKEGGMAETQARASGPSKREQFATIAARFPEGSVTESHRRMARRCWPQDDEDCQGVMVVIGNDWPHISVRCDSCGFEASYPFKALLGGVLPDEPPVPSRPVPDPQPQVPVGQHRSQPLARTRDLQPARMDERSLRWRR